VVITAIVLIQTAVDRRIETAQAIADIEGVSEVYSCTGDIDLIAIVRVRDHEEIANLVPGRIDKIPGVLDSNTHIAFRSYSRRDAEEGFSIGLQE
jgi:DNA-binding Lrp family transcriptional regulator